MNTSIFEHLAAQIKNLTPLTRPVILLVEDQPHFMEQARAATSRFPNAEFIFATTLADAKKMLADVPVDLIVSDAIFPPGDGHPASVNSGIALLEYADATKTSIIFCSSIYHHNDALQPLTDAFRANPGMDDHPHFRVMCDANIEKSETFEVFRARREQEYLSANKLDLSADTQDIRLRLDQITAGLLDLEQETWKNYYHSGELTEKNWHSVIIYALLAHQLRPLFYAAEQNPKYKTDGLDEKYKDGLLSFSEILWGGFFDHDPNNERLAKIENILSGLANIETRTATLATMGQDYKLTDEAVSLIKTMADYFGKAYCLYTQFPEASPSAPLSSSRQVEPRVILFPSLKGGPA